MKNKELPDITSEDLLSRATAADSEMYIHSEIKGGISVDWLDTNLQLLQERGVDIPFRLKDTTEDTIIKTVLLPAEAQKLAGFLENNLNELLLAHCEISTQSSSNATESAEETQEAVLGIITVISWFKKVAASEENTQIATNRTDSRVMEFPKFNNVERLQTYIASLRDTNNFKYYIASDTQENSVLQNFYSLDSSRLPEFAKAIPLGDSYHADICRAFAEYIENNEERFLAARAAVDEFIANRSYSSTAVEQLEETILKPLLIDMVPTLLAQEVNPLDLRT